MLATDATGSASDTAALRALVVKDLPASTNVREIPFSFDAGTSYLSGTISRCNVLTYAATITGVSMVANATGNATVDIQTVSLASYTGPSSASSITASATPTLNVAAKYSDSTLTGWSKSIAANTVVCAVMSGAASLSWIAGKLSVTAN